MTELWIHSPGPLCSVQDLGRFGYQSLGVPPAGAADRDALETANLLVGNDRGEACLECTLGGLELECTGPLDFAICGAALEVLVNGSPHPLYETLSAQKGDVIALSSVTSGLRSYIAFAGGLGIEPVLGSRSTYARAGFGGWMGRALRAGDRLPLRKPTGMLRGESRLLWVPESLRPSYPLEISVRAIASHEESRFEPASFDRFFQEAYRVSGKSDRMGCRLEGPALSHSRGADIISSGVQTGTVQVPGNGLPIVLLADRQTTGGYTRIAHVIQADLPKLGQARPGDSVRFVRTTVEAAREAWLRREREIVARVVEKNISREAAPRHFRVTVNGQAYKVELREVP